MVCGLVYNESFTGNFSVFDAEFIYIYIHGICSANLKTSFLQKQLFVLYCLKHCKNYWLQNILPQVYYWQTYKHLTKCNLLHHGHTEDALLLLWKLWKTNTSLHNLFSELSTTLSCLHQTKVDLDYSLINHNFCTIMKNITTTYFF